MKCEKCDTILIGKINEEKNILQFYCETCEKFINRIPQTNAELIMKAKVKAEKEIDEVEKKLENDLLEITQEIDRNKTGLTDLGRADLKEKISDVKDNIKIAKKESKINIEKTIANLDPPD